MGWQPPHIQEDPVHWMARSFNKVADGLADFTMDRERSWQKIVATWGDPCRGNLIVQTDGGRRTAQCAASAAIVGLLTWVDGTFTYEPWFARGLFLSGGETVFQAEAIALDIAVSWLRGAIF